MVEAGAAVRGRGKRGPRTDGARFQREIATEVGSRPSRRASNGGPLWRSRPEPVLPTEVARNRRAHDERGINHAFCGHRFCGDAQMLCARIINMFLMIGHVFEMVFLVLLRRLFIEKFLF